MKKVLVIGIVSAMMVGGAAVAFASDSFNNWAIELQASTTTGTAAFNQTYVGIASNCTSNTTKNGADAEVTTINTNQAEITAYDKTATLTSTTDNYGCSRYKIEYYKPMAPGPYNGQPTPDVWNMNMFVAGTASTFGGNGQIQLLAWQPSKNGTANIGLDPSLYYSIGLYITSNTGMDFNAADSSLLWDIKGLNGVNSTSTSGEFSTTMSAVNYGTVVAGSGGLGSTAYHLQMVAFTPEPGSLLVLLSGCVGLVGYGIRRRK